MATTQLGLRVRLKTHRHGVGGRAAVLDYQEDAAGLQCEAEEEVAMAAAVAHAIASAWSRGRHGHYHAAIKPLHHRRIQDSRFKIRSSPDVFTDAEKGPELRVVELRALE
eukprot:7788025-Pyramimonas_sp.AAC.1